MSPVKVPRLLSEPNARYIFTDEDLLLLNYFLENKLPDLITAKATSRKRTISEYSSDFDDFDYESRIGYFKDRGWLTEKGDGRATLRDDIFDELITNGTLQSECVLAAKNRSKHMDIIEAMVQSGSLTDVQSLMLIYIWRQSVDDLGDRWLADKTTKAIEKWEDDNCLDHTLSDNYPEALNFLKSRGFIFVKEETAYGNPRLYGVNKSIKNQLSNLSELSQSNLRKVAETHMML